MPYQTAKFHYYFYYQDNADDYDNDEDDYDNDDDYYYLEI